MSPGQRALRAVVCSAEASLPLEGSVRPQQPISSNAAMRGSSSRFCSSLPSRSAMHHKGLFAHYSSSRMLQSLCLHAYSLPGT